MNIATDTMKAFKGADEFQNRIVAFVDVMGMKNKMLQAKKPEDFQVYSTILNMFANQPYAKGKLRVSIFSDCMYVIAKKEFADYVINFLANFSYTLLSSNTPIINVHPDGSYDAINHLDCFKLRGGITYGKVFALDEAAENNGLLFHSNIVLGPAAIKAYLLESEAVYPRIIVDENFLQLIEDMGKTTDEYYLIRDDETDYYLDFISYMCKGRRENSIVIQCLESYIDFIKEELEEALHKNNAKLVGQLLWYIKYLQRQLKAPN